MGLLDRLGIGGRALKAATDVSHSVVLEHVLAWILLGIAALTDKVIDLQTGYPSDPSLEHYSG
ncbi:MAG TPA: hypothetical protein VKB09_13085 [Thermomicrobiales bacterium]|nr:hypothetical protein [Thermomicrobiales bacterium]